MGFWSSLWSGISKACQPIANAVSNVLQNSPLMQKLMPMLMAVIPPPFDAIAFVALEVLSAAMGKPENPDELGWQMNEADKKPEDFGSFDEYREYLDKEYPFDRDAFAAQTDEQKLACRYVGMSGVAAELENANGFKLNPMALGTLAGACSAMGWDQKMVSDFSRGMMTSLRGDAGRLFNMLGDFAKGELNSVDAAKVSDGIKNGLKASGSSDSVAGFEKAMDRSVSATAETVANVSANANL